MFITKALAHIIKIITEYLEIQFLNIVDMK